MRPRVNIIVAVASDGAIGRRGDLVFHVSADLRRFKVLTMGYPVIMGRKTFESLPKGALPGRRNIVVTRSAEWSAPDVETAASIEDAVAMCDGAGEVFIIGGAQIYGQSMPLADRLCLTRFDRTADDADCFFPAIDPAEWGIVETSDWVIDEKSGVGYKFENLERK